MKVLGVPSESFEGKTERVLKNLYRKSVERKYPRNTGTLEQKYQEINKFLSDEYTKYAKNPYFLRL